MFSIAAARVIRVATFGSAGILAVAVAAGAQTMLTLEQAMALARSETPEAHALAAAADAATTRVRQARAGYLPRVDVGESVQRGDQPVFVFSSLLSQRRFTAANFDIARLNQPAALTNTRTSVTVEQPIFDGGATRHAAEGAALGRDIAALDRTRGSQDLAFAAARAFVRVLQLESAERATAAAVDAAQSDLERARARRDAGVATDADVLAVQVHLADMQQRQLAAHGDVAVARLQLNQALGVPLDRDLALVVPPSPTTTPDASALVVEAVRGRPELRQADLRVKLAENAAGAARAAFLPTVSAQGGWEFDGSTFSDQRTGWLVGAQVRLNVFNGFADAARVAEARDGERQAAAERARLARVIEVDVRAALATLAAARAREAAGRTALDQARESQRIVRDRYDTGLATITDVLRAAEAALDAESRATAAQMDVILDSVALDRAAGRL